MNKDESNQANDDSWPLSPEEIQNATNLLANGSMFRDSSVETRQKVAKMMRGRNYQYDDKIVEEGNPTHYIYLLNQGQTLRTRNLNGIEHQIDVQNCGSVISSLHSINEDPTYATATCIEDKCQVFTLRSNILRQIIREDPDVATDIIVSLSREIRSRTKAMRTPLFEIHGKPFKLLPIVSVAAGVESYYRSALNSMINARLTGKTASLFPNMSVQVPARVVYVNGLKGIRQYVDLHFDPKKYSNPLLVGALASTLPGIIMTPVSSILEASNAGHCNPKPLYLRWTGGIIPRSFREIIFGIGLNQLTDFFEERALEYVTNDAIANTIGSVSAGIVAGYLSHVPHNLSTYKLLNPHKSYGVLFKEFVQLSSPKILVPNKLPKAFLPLYSTMIACLFPRGCILRTTQIVGSFILLNGTINLLQKTQ